MPAMIAPILLAALVGTYVPHDGDSGRLILADGQSVKVRLAGLDAAETAPFTRCRKQPAIPACQPQNRRYGPLASTRARQLAQGGAECRPTGERPSYNRTIARCYVNGQDIGSILVREGLAISEKQFGNQYAREQEEARRAHRGIWK